MAQCGVNEDYGRQLLKRETGGFVILHSKSILPYEVSKMMSNGIVVQNCRTDPQCDSFLTDTALNYTKLH